MNSSPYSEMPTQRERRYRGKPSHPLPVWNGILEHLSKMGISIWLYLWCIDRITYEQDGIGHVLGGSPVKIMKIAEDLGRSPRSVRRDLERLRSHYLHLRWTPYGYVIKVLNSRKFSIWGSSHTPAPNGEPRDKSGQAKAKNGRAVTETGRSKEDAAIAAVDTAAKQPLLTQEGGIWKFLGIEPCGPPQFRRLLESGWTSRNGQQPSILIGETIDAWEEVEGRKLPQAQQLFSALAKLRRREREELALRDVSEEDPLANLRAKAEEIPPWNR